MHKMNIAASCWRNSIRASRWTRCSQFTPAAQRRWYADQIDVPYKRYPRLNGGLEIQHLTEEHDEYLCANGIPGLYTSVGFQYAYTDWQAHILRELNTRLHDFTHSTHSSLDVVLQIIRHSAKRQDENAALFNFASMAWNNMFFFQGLRFGVPDVQETTDMPQNIQNIIIRDYGNLENLKAEFLARAKAMFAPGFVWLVMDKEYAQQSFGTRQVGASERRLGILCTYGAGSPLSAAHWRMQSNEKQINFDAAGSAYLTAARIAHGATLECDPLLCVSTWQHSYIPDWEVHGRARFLDAWWDRINWSIVASKAGITPRGSRTTDSRPAQIPVASDPGDVPAEIP